jgi:hypothetical protein
MITRLIGAATLFTAGSVLLTGAPTLSANPTPGQGAGAACSMAGNCSTQEPKKDDTAKPAAKDAKKDAKAKKDGSCGKDKKEGSCGKDKKEGSCGKEKK